MVLGSVQLGSFTCEYPGVPSSFVEETIVFSFEWYPCKKLTVNVTVYSWDLYSVPLINMSVFVPVPYCFDYCSLVVQFEVRENIIPSVLFFFLNITLAIGDLLWFYTNFRIICSNSVKNNIGTLTGVALNL